ncbi:hypothetical protein [Peribacillus loiseleuriae]|uniref:hypothetical protein n=1 Tax=Peribacillus loiseleuriae TaxID=1679170 RepID=UPI003D005916
MEDIDAENKIIQEFIDDPLYKMALFYKLEELIITDKLLSISFTSNYSTNEVGKIIDRADSTIRNHFRSDLINYIKPEKVGKYYRLDYKSIFKLHLIFLLMDNAGKTTLDLLVELGIEATSSPLEGKRLRKYQNASEEKRINSEIENQDLSSKVDLLERKYIFQEVLLNILKYEKDVSEFERRIDKQSNAIEAIKNEAYIKYLEEKQSRLLISSLDKSRQKPSFLGIFKKQEEVDVEGISNEIATKLKLKMKEQMSMKIRDLSDDIILLQKERDEIISKLENERVKFSKIQIQATSNEQVLLD